MRRYILLLSFALGCQSGREPPPPDLLRAADLSAAPADLSTCGNASFAAPLDVDTFDVDCKRKDPVLLAGRMSIHSDCGRSIGPVTVRDGLIQDSKSTLFTFILDPIVMVDPIAAGGVVQDIRFQLSPPSLLPHECTGLPCKPDMNPEGLRIVLLLTGDGLPQDARAKSGPVLPSCMP